MKEKDKQMRYNMMMKKLEATRQDRLTKIGGANSITNHVTQQILAS
jgi:putative NADH-flavin reductase